MNAELFGQLKRSITASKDKAGGISGKPKKKVDEKVIMLETQVVSDGTNTHQVAICLPQSCGASSDNFHN